jgi:hypothetical protein
MDLQCLAAISDNMVGTDDKEGIYDLWVRVTVEHLAINESTEIHSDLAK